MIRKLQVKIYDQGTQTQRTVRACDEDDDFVYVPRAYGLEWCNRRHLHVEDHTTEGHRPLQSIEPIELRPYQRPFVDRLERHARDGYDVFFTAATGKGKTVMALELARRLGMPFLAVVDTEVLRDQWIDRIEEHLGISRSRIEVIQGKVRRVGSCDIGIAMLQTLYRREFPEAFYEHWGTVLFDEAHVCGAENYNRVLGYFPACLRVAMTATERRDGLSKVLHWHLGPTVEKLREEHRQSRVYYYEMEGVYSRFANYAKQTGRFISEIASDGTRNVLLARAIAYFHSRGRNILGISDRIEQLEGILSVCLHLGIPPEDIGIIAGFREHYQYVKDSNPPRVPMGVEAGAEYTPVCIEAVRRRIPREVREDTLATVKVILATYGVFGKGVDVPRLDMGIDLTPRSTFEQIHGRILRSETGKKVPIWLTPRDVNNYRAEYQFAARLRELARSNVEVHQWNPQRGVRRRDADELRREVIDNSRRLKATKIGTLRDGSYTLLT